MLDESTARETVARHPGSDEFELLEFDYGWRIAQPQLAGQTRGGGTRIIERATGKLLHFASGIAPTIIDESFDEVRPEAMELSDSGPNVAE